MDNWTYRVFLDDDDWVLRASDQEPLVGWGEIMGFIDKQGYAVVSVCPEIHKTYYYTNQFNSIQGDLSSLMVTAYRIFVTKPTKV